MPKTPVSSYWASGSRVGIQSSKIPNIIFLSRNYSPFLWDLLFLSMESPLDYLSEVIFLEYNLLFVLTFNFLTQLNLQKPHAWMSCSYTSSCILWSTTLVLDSVRARVHCCRFLPYDGTSSNFVCWHYFFAWAKEKQQFNRYNARRVLSFWSVLLTCSFIV